MVDDTTGDPASSGNHAGRIDPQHNSSFFDPAAAGWTKIRDEGFAELAGPYWERVADGALGYGFFTEERHRNRNGMIHGGVLLAFADQAMGMTAWKASGQTLQATAQLSLQFVAAVQIGDFVEAHCTVARATRSLVFMTGILTVSERVVATASGVWKLIGR